MPGLDTVDGVVMATEDQAGGLGWERMPKN
jgi:hypothetical protein